MLCTAVYTVMFLYTNIYYASITTISYTMYRSRCRCVFAVMLITISYTLYILIILNLLLVLLYTNTDLVDIWLKINCSKYNYINPDIIYGLISTIVNITI